MTDGNQAAPRMQSERHDRRRWLLAAFTFGIVWLTWRMQPPQPVPAAMSGNLSIVQAASPGETTDRTPAESAVDPASTATEPAAKVDRSRFLGQWKDEFYGERTMTFRPDGTGTMHIKLDPVSRLLYGAELTFFFSWRLDGDVLHLAMTGGEPRSATESLSQLFGKTSDRRIERLDDRELQIRSLDSQKLYVHRRE